MSKELGRHVRSLSSFTVFLFPGSAPRARRQEVVEGVEVVLHTHMHRTRTCRTRAASNEKKTFDVQSELAHPHNKCWGHSRLRLPGYKASLDDTEYQYGCYV